MFECLEADGDPNRKQNAGNKSQAFKQGHRGFNGFSCKFKLLAADLDHKEMILSDDIIHKSRRIIRHQLATGDKPHTTTSLRDSARCCQQIAQALKDSVRNRAIYEIVVSDNCSRQVAPNTHVRFRLPITGITSIPSMSRRPNT